MKKYLLWLLAIPFGLIAFSNAWYITFTSEYNDYENLASYYTPNKIYYNTNWEWFCENLYVNELGCDNSEICTFSATSNKWWKITITDDMTDDEDENITCTISDSDWVWVLTVDNLSTMPFDTLSLDNPYISETNIRWNDNNWWWDDNTWWWGGNVWSLLPWWETALSGAISWLTSTINEFIPLMVYVWLGVLGAVIWFFAIKWLIAYVRKETFTIFKK